MRTVLISLFLLLGRATYSQNDSLISEFLTDILERENDTSIIAYTETIGSDYYDYLPHFFLSKGKVWDRETKRYVMRFSRKERRSIDEAITKKRDLLWSDSLLPQSELINPENNNSYIRDHPTRHIYQFTSPIFFRNNSIALIMIKHHYPGNKKGYAESVIYSRQGGVWRRFALIERNEWGY
ncbi:MAG: hypothetical protein NTW29_14910 [Bacteroidetes bacterium]|nr:hypothetical protein [Bacteroidota bacterium]